MRQRVVAGLDGQGVVASGAVEQGVTDEGHADGGAVVGDGLVHHAGHHLVVLGGEHGLKISDGMCVMVSL